MRNKAAIAVLLVLLGLGAVRVATHRGDPELIIDDSVAADFAAVATEDWETFLDAIPAHVGCVGDVTLVADYELDDLAKYDTETARMFVRVPAPRVLLDRALIHELAHHLEFSCKDQIAMRSEFEAALGCADCSWFTGPTWETTPSEIFAEALAEYVLDERGRSHTKMGRIDQDAVDVVAHWATTS